MDQTNDHAVIDFNAEAIPDVEYPHMDFDFHETFKDCEMMNQEVEEEAGEETRDSESQNQGNTTSMHGWKKFTVLTNETRLNIYHALLGKAINGRLPRKATSEVSNIMSIPVQTIRKIWAIHKNTPADKNVDVSDKKSKCGRKRFQLNEEKVQEIPATQRTTLRSFGASLGVSHSTLHRHLERGSIRRHSNAIKPYLKDANKRARLEFCISMINQRNSPNDSRFIDMCNFIHIDEKWFYMTKKKETYYLLPNEEDPLRICQSKNFIGKVMFLVTMERPRFDSEGNETFSGKIGVFPFVNLQEAQRRSIHREAGTLEMIPITSVTRDIVKDFLINKVIPAIQEKWPRSHPGEVIYIQQDNARTHVKPNDAEFQLAVSQSSLDIRLVCQPPNSPDMNILDLGFFNAIQSLQHKESPRSIEQLVNAVIKAFNNYPSQKGNYVWLSLQLCMLQIMKHGGSHQYKVPHINKEQLDRYERLPTQISIDPEVILNVNTMLQ